MNWIRRKFSRKIGFAFTLLLAATVYMAGHLALVRLEQNLLGDIKEQLASNALGLSELIGRDDFLNPGAEFFSQVDALGQKSGTRLTLIRRDGVVLADSDVEPAHIASVENHGSRPEVAEAYRSGFGYDIRLSQTTGLELLYAAVPYPSVGPALGSVRLAVPLTRLREKVRTARNAVYASGGLVALAGLLVVGLVSRKVSQPIALMSAAAERIAAGETSVRVPVDGSDEVGRLAANFNHMVKELDGALVQLRTERDSVGTILSNMAEQVVAVDLAGKVLFMNPAAETLFGVSSSAATGRPFVEAIRQASISEMLKSVLDDREAKSGELRIFLHEEKFFDARAIPLKNGDEQRGALLVLHDVTRIQNLEQVRKDFIANVSHELRTPLTAIQGFSETLLDGGLQDLKNNRSFVESIHDESKRLSNLVNDLLDLSAIESGKAKPKHGDFSLYSVSREVETELSASAKKAGVVLRNRLPPDLTIRADREQIKQVFLNLMDNAVKFNKRGGEVFLDAEERDDQVRISVRDTGSGIPAKDLPRIFERFYRVDKARSRELGGTGLGLAIVKHIVESHGGGVRVESVEAQGSAFVVTLPKSPA